MRDLLLSGATGFASANCNDTVFNPIILNNINTANSQSDPVLDFDKVSTLSPSCNSALAKPVAPNNP
ncbi:MAG: hypothetical protein ACKVH8_18210 [Pirellulales bacterium]